MKSKIIAVLCVLLLAGCYCVPYDGYEGYQSVLRPSPSVVPQNWYLNKTPYRTGKWVEETSTSGAPRVTYRFIEDKTIGERVDGVEKELAALRKSVGAVDSKTGDLKTDLTNHRRDFSKFQKDVSDFMKKVLNRLPEKQAE